ncbi:hypothetical protein AcW1_003314 [Taiwanofungus camphoratus]|nr:hypothetical protein AcW1_003314 [Antrodia cinnamomea]
MKGVEEGTGIEGVEVDEVELTEGVKVDVGGPRGGSSAGAGVLKDKALKGRGGGEHGMPVRKEDVNVVRVEGEIEGVEASKEGGAVLSGEFDTSKGEVAEDGEAAIKDNGGWGAMMV